MLLQASLEFWPLDCMSDFGFPAGMSMGHALDDRPRQRYPSHSGDLDCRCWERTETFDQTGQNQ